MVDSSPHDFPYLMVLRRLVEPNFLFLFRNSALDHCIGPFRCDSQGSLEIHLQRPLVNIGDEG